MTEEQKVIAEAFQVAANDLASHHAAILRLQENQEAQQKKLVEFGEMINAHSKLLETMQQVWTKNFADLGALVNQQTRMLEVLRSIVLKNEPGNEPVN